MRTDTTYRISVKTERNTFIKEKAGSIALMITMIFLGIVTVLLILISNILEKQYPDN